MITAGTPAPGSVCAVVTGKLRTSLPSGKRRFIDGEQVWANVPDWRWWPCIVQSESPTAGEVTVSYHDTKELHQTVKYEDIKPFVAAEWPAPYAHPKEFYADMLKSAMRVLADFGIVDFQQG